MDLTGAPGEAYSAPCKDCGKLYSYSIYSARQDEARGLSPPERCAECRALHGREIASIGVSHFVARARDGGPVPAEISRGRLGKIDHPERVHRLNEGRSIIDEVRDQFGITEDDLDALFRALRDRQVVIVEGGTGSGKSTFLPARLIEPDSPLREQLWRARGPIIVTQPRRHPTESIPARIGELLGCGVGPGLDIGFHYHGNNQSDLNRNRLIFMTDGVLVNWLTDGSRIDRIAAVMIDEAHERSTNIDLILALLRRVLPRHPSLRLIIASATIDVDSFRSYFGAPGYGSTELREPTSGLDDDELQLAKVPIVKCTGTRSFGYDVTYRSENAELPYGNSKGRADAKFKQLVTDALVEQALAILSDPDLPPGDILGFLHTADAVNQAVKSLRDHLSGLKLTYGVDVFPLYRDLSSSERWEATGAKQDPSRRRVIIATNIAETSLTVDNLVFVVDSGLVVTTKWDDEAEQTDYPTTIHSQAGCRQRWGRTGRVCKGHVYTLYSERQFKDFAEYTAPEVTRSRLDQLVLKVKSAGLDPENLRWLAAPEAGSFGAAARRLENVAALSSDGDLTEHGLEIRNAAVSPEFATLMAAADQFACALEMATLIAMLNARGGEGALLVDPKWDAVTRHAARRIHGAMREGVRDDLEFLLKLYSGWAGETRLAGRHDGAAWAERNFVNHHFMAEIRKQRRELLAPLSGHGKEDQTRAINFALADKLRAILFMWLPDAIFQRDPASASRYLSNAGMRATVSSKSCLSVDLAERVAGLLNRVDNRERIRIWINSGALVDPVWESDGRESFLARCQKVASWSRGQDGELLASSVADRILLDQRAPLGTRFTARRTAAESQLQLEAYLGGSPGLRPKDRRLAPRTDAGDGTPGEEEVPLQATDGPFLTDALEAPEEKEETPEVQDENDLVSYAGHGNGGNAAAMPLAARLEDPNTDLPESFTAEVVGYDHTGERSVVVLRATQDDADPWDTFLEQYVVGDEVTLEVQGADLDEDDRFNVLVTREPISGLEICLEPEDVTVDGFGWALDRIPKGATTRAVIREIDAKSERAYASLLPLLGDDKATQQETWPQTMRAVIGKVRNDDADQGGKGTLELLLTDVSNQRIGILHTAAVGERHLPLGLSQYLAEQELNVKLRSAKGKADLRALPEDFDVAHLDARFHWHPRKHVLVFNGRMSAIERERFLAAAPTRAFDLAVEELYRTSNRILVDVVDPVTDQAFAEVHPIGSAFDAKVMEVLPDGIIVAVDGLRFRIPRVELSWDREARPTDIARPGDSLRVVAYGKDDRPQLSVRRLSPDPIKAFRASSPNEWIEGTIKSIDWSRGLRVELTGQVRGIVPFREVPDGNREASSRFNPGLVIRARVLSVDGESQLVVLSMKELKQTSYPVGQVGEKLRAVPPAPRQVVPIRDEAVERDVSSAMPSVEVEASVRLKITSHLGEERVGAMVALRDFRGFDGPAVRQLRNHLGVTYLQFIEWNPEPDRLIRNAFLERTAYGPMDSVTSIQWSPGHVTVTVAKGRVGQSVGPAGLRVRMLARLIGAYVKIVEQG